MVKKTSLAYIMECTTLLCFLFLLYIVPPDQYPLLRSTEWHSCATYPMHTRYTSCCDHTSATRWRSTTETKVSMSRTSTCCLKGSQIALPSRIRGSGWNNWFRMALTVIIFWIWITIIDLQPVTFRVVNKRLTHVVEFQVQ